MMIKNKMSWKVANEWDKIYVTPTTLATKSFSVSSDPKKAFKFTPDMVFTGPPRKSAILEISTLKEELANAK